MSKVFFSVSMSIDGFIAPESRADDIGEQRWMRQWGELQGWVFPLAWFRENLHLGPGGEGGPSNALIEETHRRTGVSIMGKRMFDGGERQWPEDAPFHTPVFVLTHQVRDPWVRPGGTTFHFVNDGIERALHQARAVAGDRDIRIAGGAHTIREYLQAGLVDEFHIALSPTLFGSGVALFDRLDPSGLDLEVTRVIDTPTVTHLTYAVHRRET